MRMWMINPSKLCKKHLLGEHGELHKFMKSWEKQHSITGRIAVNSVEPMSYKSRHDALALEMQKRGFNHSSPLSQPDFGYLSEHERNTTVDVFESTVLLINRCADCAERMGL